MNNKCINTCRSIPDDRFLSSDEALLSFVTKSQKVRIYGASDVQ